MFITLTVQVENFCASCFYFWGKYLIKYLIISREQIRGNPGKEPEI